MKKQIIAAFAFSMAATFSFAQKKELKQAERAILKSHYADAKTALKLVEPMIGSLDNKLKSKYYYLKSMALFSKGAGSQQDIKKAVTSLDQVTTGYTKELKELKASIVNNLVEKGNKAYEAKDYKGASMDYEQIYSMRPQDTVYLYYAAATAVSVPDYDRALKLYAKLKKLGYEGVETRYQATDKKSGELKTFGNKTERDIAIKTGAYIKPVENKTESKKSEIVKNVALIYVTKGDDEKAVEAMDDAIAENPNDVNLILTQANVYYKMGNKEKFRSLLEKATSMDPKNAELQYNLGVIAAESNDTEAAKRYYQKAIDLDPKFVNAYINMAALILQDEKPIIEKMNTLGASDADNKRYEDLKEQRIQLYKKAIPFLAKVLDFDPKNISATTTLKNIYGAIGDTENFNAMKEKLKMMEQTGN